MINYLYQEQNWQSQLSDLITDPRELLNILELSEQQLLSGALLASNQFKLRIPRAFVAKMQKGNPLDPLLLPGSATSFRTGRSSWICDRPFG